MDPSFSDWNRLPNEIRAIVVGNLEKETRMTLRLCSKNDRDLVDSVHSRIIHSLELSKYGSKWKLKVLKYASSNQITWQFAIFEEFQRILTKEIENNDYIQNMVVTQLNTEEPLNLLRFGELAKIEKLTFCFSGVNTLNTLPQVDPFFLKKLDFMGEILDQEVYDLNQLKYTDFSIDTPNYIDDQQLLSYEGSEIILLSSECITVTGINNFIKKRVANLDEKPTMLQMFYDQSDHPPNAVIDGIDIASFKAENVVLINSPLGEVQLEVGFTPGIIQGRTIASERKAQENETEIPISFKRIEFMEINTCGDLNEKKSLGIMRKNGVHTMEEFDSAEDLQKKITESVEDLNYIRELTIRDTSHKWKLTSSNKDQIAVGVLTLSGGDNDIDYLRQIEPIHLKEILIQGATTNEEIYSLPQIIHVEKLCDYFCLIRDDQLFKLNASKIELHTEFNGGRRNLTDSGINAFLNSRAPHIYQRGLSFTAFNLPDVRNLITLFNGLGFNGLEEPYDPDKGVTINSPYPEYQLEAKVFPDKIQIERVTNV